MRNVRELMRRLTAVVAALALVGTALPAAAAPSGAPIRIGSTLALTGPLAPTALIHKIAGEIYVEQLNRGNGLLGRPVEWVLYDDQSKPDVTRSLYEKLITEDKVDLIMGPYATSGILAAMGVAQRYQKMIIHHSFGCRISPPTRCTSRWRPSGPSRRRRSPAWCRRPRHADPAEDGGHRHEQVSLRAISVQRRPRGGREARVEGPPLPRVRVRHAGLGLDRRTGEGCQSGLPLGGRAGARRQSAPGGAQEARLLAAAPLPPLPRARPHDHRPGGEARVVEHVLRQHPRSPRRHQRAAGRPLQGARHKAAFPYTALDPGGGPFSAWQVLGPPSPPPGAWTTRSWPSGCGRTGSTPWKASCASTAPTTTATTSRKCARCRTGSGWWCGRGSSRRRAPASICPSAERHPPRAVGRVGAARGRALRAPRARAQPELGPAAPGQPRPLRAGLPRRLPDLSSRHRVPLSLAWAAAWLHRAALFLSGWGSTRCSPTSGHRVHLAPRHFGITASHRSLIPVVLDGRLPPLRDAVPSRRAASAPSSFPPSSSSPGSPPPRWRSAPGPGSG